MSDPIAEYLQWKKQGGELRAKAKQAIEARFRELLIEAVQLAEEYRSGFGGTLTPPAPVTSFKFKAGAKKTAKKSTRPAMPAPIAPATSAAAAPPKPAAAVPAKPAALAPPTPAAAVPAKPAAAVHAKPAALAPPTPAAAVHAKPAPLAPPTPAAAVHAKPAALAPAKPNVWPLTKQLAAARKKLEAAKAKGAPTKNLEDRVYELEDDLRLASQSA